MTSTPLAVIVLAYNTRDLVAQCLSQFHSPLLERGAQLILVDNASSDGVSQMVAGQFPGVDIVRSEMNRGFAGGNNLGLRQVRADCPAILLLNSDVIAPASTLLGLAEELQRQPDVGALSAGLVTAAGKPQAFAYGNDPTLGYLFRRALHAAARRGPLHHWDVSSPVDTQWVSGACLCVQSAAVRQVGELDERFFLYFEDNDWCRRMRLAGWRIVYDPRYRVTHLGGASQPERRKANALYYRSMVAFYAKHYGPLPALALRAMLAPYRLLTALR